ncbi:class I SAM-dependent rRNA methyltransferase [Cupriavidus gilardii]|uniref:class I SAM-dependent rRNA methyltransferase n=1 Tax=Cupriavidus gilardii TaxID=82541 RepID=UPI0018E68460|nr:class I SAM-dependent rRNA methyltransferase [Cupriavidus gilardii]QQE07136.1 class I SAM-dependent rRNA methyltransferase [Cupriavidus sp. ISTL7]UXC35678.1 class I SAM-dependent rRNA methyltransferase [Cupriavidus gilardii]
MNTLTLKPGKEKSLLRRHPWIYATGVDRVEGRAEPGATITVRAADGRFLAKAAYSPHSQIRARVWTFDENEPVDHALIKRRVAAAVAHRRQWVSDSDAVRLVFGEADRLPGLVVDYYGAGRGAGQAQLVCQFNAAGVEQWKDAIVQALVRETGCPNVYERSDAAVREREGLELVTGVLAGAEPDPELSVTEHGVRYYVDVRNGHKTGFYVDQRDNRKLVGDLAEGREVLNCFCYTGGFSLAALRGGAASVVSIDSSGEALKIAEGNVALNGFDAGRATWLDADVFKSLRQFRAEGRQFDLIVLDPPKFAPSAQHIDRAARAYKEINLVGMQLLRPGGLLFTYSCSGAIGMELFHKIVAGAATDARVDARILRRLSAGTDHPMLAAFPEGEYLKGLLLQRV